MILLSLELVCFSVAGLLKKEILVVDPGYEMCVCVYVCIEIHTAKKKHEVEEALPPS